MRFSVSSDVKSTSFTKSVEDTTTCSFQKVTSQAGKRAALNELRSAAAAMLRSSREFRHSCSEGEAAGPCVAATEFASLVVEQVRRLQVRPIGTEG